MIGSASDRTVMGSAQETQRASKPWGGPRPDLAPTAMSLWDSLARASSARQRAAPGAVPGRSLCATRSGAQEREQWRRRRPAATEILSLRPRTAGATAGTTWCQTIAPKHRRRASIFFQCSRFNMAASECSRWTDLAAARFVEAFHSGVEVDQPPAGTLQGWP